MIAGFIIHGAVDGDAVMIIGGADMAAALAEAASVVEVGSAAEAEGSEEEAPPGVGDGRAKIFH